MRYRKLSPSGDYQFGNQQSDFWRDVPQAVGQAVGTRLRLWLGEWYLDISDGTPYVQGVIGKHADLQNLANRTIQQRAIDTQGMIDIATFTSTINPDTRKYTATFSINTIYGPTEVQVENYTLF